jgi:hypothetical protein
MDENRVRELDYKKMYLEERIRGLQIEAQAIQLRFNQVQQEISIVQKELEEHINEKQDSD